MENSNVLDQLGEARVSMTLRCGCRTECRAGRLARSPNGAAQMLAVGVGGLPGGARQALTENSEKRNCVVCAGSTCTHKRGHGPNVRSCGRTGHAGMAGMT